MPVGRLALCFENRGRPHNEKGLRGVPAGLFRLVVEADAKKSRSSGRHIGKHANVRRIII